MKPSEASRHAVPFVLVALLLMVGSGGLTTISAQPVDFVLKWGSNGSGDGQFSFPGHAVLDAAQQQDQ